MAEILITAMGDLSIPMPLGAGLAEMEWPGGGRVSTLKLFLGRETVEIWPADPKRIRELAKRLEEAASRLEDRQS